MQRYFLPYVSGDLPTASSRAETARWWGCLPPCRPTRAGIISWPPQCASIA